MPFRLEVETSNIITRSALIMRFLIAFEMTKNKMGRHAELTCAEFISVFQYHIKQKNKP